MTVPRETILGGVIRPLSVRAAVADAFRAEIKTAHRVQVTHQNSQVRPGHFRGLNLESGRAGRDPVSNAPRIRARCAFDSGAVRVVTVSPVVVVGDWFWIRTGNTSRAQSLITVEVTGMYVARLQDMSDAAALAEGVAVLPGKFRGMAGERQTTPREWFARHWDTMQGVRKAPNLRAPWSANPWVWIYGFKTYRKNVDEIAGKLEPGRDD